MVNRKRTFAVMALLSLALAVFGGYTLLRVFDRGKSQIATSHSSGCLLDVIMYEGTCYYGLEMTQEIEDTTAIEDWEMIGEFAGVVPDKTSPTEELTSTVDFGEIGTEIFHYVNEEGKHVFVVPGRARDTWWGIWGGHTNKPDYYDKNE